MDRVAINLRLPADLHSRLVRLAERERRSLNEQLVYLLDLAAPVPAPVGGGPCAVCGQYAVYVNSAHLCSECERQAAADFIARHFG